MGLLKKLKISKPAPAVTVEPPKPLKYVPTKNLDKLRKPLEEVREKLFKLTKENGITQQSVRLFAASSALRGVLMLLTDLESKTWKPHDNQIISIPQIFLETGSHGDCLVSARIKTLLQETKHVDEKAKRKVAQDDAADLNSGGGRRLSDTASSNSIGKLQKQSNRKDGARRSGSLSRLKLQGRDDSDGAVGGTDNVIKSVSATGLSRIRKLKEMRLKRRKHDR